MKIHLSYYVCALVAVFCTNPAITSAQPLSLNVEGLGSLTVPESAEPVDIVIRFAREVRKQGIIL